MDTPRAAGGLPGRRCRSRGTVRRTRAGRSCPRRCARTAYRSARARSPIHRHKESSLQLVNRRLPLSKPQHPVSYPPSTLRKPTIKPTYGLRGDLAHVVNRILIAQPVGALDRVVPEENTSGMSAKQRPGARNKERDEVNGRCTGCSARHGRGQRRGDRESGEGARCGGRSSVVALTWA